MSSFDARVLSLILLALAFAGCNGLTKPKPAPQPTSAPAPEETWTTTPIPGLPQPSMAVKEGGIPLVYLLESTAMVRVADVTKNEDLLKIPVPGRTIIAVTEGGVTVGGATMKMGPLPTDHRYAIYLENTESNYIRSGSIRPGKPKPPVPPATQDSQ